MKSKKNQIIKTDSHYKDLLVDIKNRIKESQLKATVTVNKHLLFLYWQIGNLILERQESEGWGTKIIDNLSRDIKLEFPNLKGFSPRNLKYMRRFAELYSNNFLHNRFKKLLPAHIPGNKAIVQVPLAQIEEMFMQVPLAQLSWYHHITLMEKVKNVEDRLWYMSRAIEYGWSRNIMLMQIEKELYARQEKKKKITNFRMTLPPPDSDYANYMLKDPYIFDFINVSAKAQEKDIEEQLTNHITKFLLELGQGFAFVGRQFHIEIGSEDYYIDLLFYHIKLKCYVVIELKTTDFKPEYAGKLNFYISVVNDTLKSKTDSQTIGILLCKGRNDIVAEYSLAAINRPIGVADYQFMRSIPENLKTSLPSIEEIEKELMNNTQFKKK
ncbi:MAG: hypothetical protein A2X61_08405 [Ignavibacteria bacterium GWB2_35_12]|nr:MAG: hypothetical protein A2X63_02295 [Ignavibacteria bacterium GWA2_35_8]OGU40177.1 MAG: hypothetical protein A2X61_08405 [Ignavibacteria bacterium GWB2_35_12]OGU92371.1 MAG: hypothetical protein A2220_16850 [Ignavibacteria bacterium RIFOXYA2_FULL_35_10]OGV22332.1 MAG: hypothetical protein A2475_15690 [Ignavibacteria bacterium RIFOXYC2_FULL_35_21]